LPLLWLFLVVLLLPSCPRRPLDVAVAVAVAFDEALGPPSDAAVSRPAGPLPLAVMPRPSILKILGCLAWKRDAKALSLVGLMTRGGPAWADAGQCGRLKALNDTCDEHRGTLCPIDVVFVHADRMRRNPGTAEAHGIACSHATQTGISQLKPCNSLPLPNYFFCSPSFLAGSGCFNL
jgi:hypothetical protein